MKKLLAIGVALTMFAMFTPAAIGDDSETITVVMTPGGVVDINITDSSSAGGNVITTWNPSCIVGDTNNEETLSAFIWNDGTVNVTVNVTATDTTDWTLTNDNLPMGETRHDRFSLEIYQNSSVGDWDSTSHFDNSFAGGDPSIYPYIYTAEDSGGAKEILNNDLETSAAGTHGYTGIDITLTMPTTSSTNTTQTTEITFTATAN